ncbi:hypothetical protein CEY12_07650 [Chryseobacterium sp. T16E-39]|nr:hypothetical protein CEY12_07650 [Chryseobacterium sp. T16E-39]
MENDKTTMIRDMNKKELLTVELQEKISKAISKIGNVPSHLIPKINESNDDAYPYVEIGDDSVIYVVIKERGVEYERNFCRDTDDALLKLFRYNSYEIARAKEKNNPNYSVEKLKDMQLKILKTINPSWNLE